MNEYDEDLSENPWYLAFVHGQSKLFAEVTGERWIVCVPKFGSWRGNNDVPKTIGASNFQSHCMKYDGEESSTTAIVNGVHILKKIHRYVTHNGKTLLVDGATICCGSGFEESATSFNSKSGLLDLPPSGLNHHAKILFEETYFNSKDQSYKMLCLSRPLELHLAPEEIQDKKDEFLSCGNDGIGFEKSSSFLWRKSARPEKLKKIIDGKIANYIKYHGVGKMTVAESVMNQKSEILEWDDITGLDACEAAVSHLFNTCLEIMKKDSKIKKELDTNPSNAIEVAVEKYILQEVYGSVSRQIASTVADQEAFFNKKICNLSDIQPRDLEIDEKYWLSLPRAKRHISKINRCYTPYDKLMCVQRTISCITAKRELPREDALGSDDLLPTLIYLVIKSGIPNWISNLVYLKRFKLVSSNDEQSNYFVATLEAAVKHINSTNFKLPSKLFAEKQSDGDAVHEYFQKVRDGDTDGVRHMLSTSASNTKEREKKMCHPLCDCNACSRLKRSKSLMRTENIVSVYERNEKGQTALHVAALLGRHELVDILLGSGAEINAIDYRGSTPLHCAALSGSQSVVFLLLHHGANQSATDNNNNTPLHLCCQRGHETCAKAILYFDPMTPVASVKMDNDDGNTPLHIASKWGYVGIVSALIESGADHKAVNRRRQSTIDVSLNENVSSTIKDAANQVIRIVRTLKYMQSSKPKAVEPLKDTEKKTRPRTSTVKEVSHTVDSAFVAKQIEKLFRAVKDHDLNMVRFLCGWPESEDKDLNNFKKSPCHPLCQCPKCQPLSQEHVLHANSANEEKYTGIMFAAKHGFLEMTELFLQHGACVNVHTKKHGYSPLHFACESGNIQVLQAILGSEGANPDIRDENGSTPLYVCAINNFVDCASILMEHNASINIRNRSGDTPLHAAVNWRNLDTVKLFLEYGALMYYKNNTGLTPLDLSEEDLEVKNLLLHIGSTAKSHSSTSQLTPLGVSPHTLVDHHIDTDSTHLATYGERTSESEKRRDDSEPLFSDSGTSLPPTPPISITYSVCTEEDITSHQSVHSSACEDCDCSRTVDDTLPDSDRRMPSTTSDIFCDIGVQHLQGPGVELSLPSSDNETSLLLSGESDAIQVTDEGSSEQTVESERYFEMG